MWLDKVLLRINRFRCKVRVQGPTIYGNEYPIKGENCVHCTYNQNEFERIEKS